MLPLFACHRVFVMRADVLRGCHQKARRAAGRIADGILRGGLQKLHHHFDDVARRAELAVLAGGGKFSQHVFIQVALHIQIGNVMLIQVVQSGDDFLQHLRRGNQEHRVAHVPGERAFFSVRRADVRDFRQLALFRKIRQASVLHVFDGGEDPLGNHVVNVARVVVLELAPAHGLSDRGLREDFLHLLAAHLFKRFGFQLFFVERADEHQIGQLFDDRQGIGNAARPDVRPDFIYFIFDGARNHAFFPPFWYQKQNLLFLPISQFDNLDKRTTISIFEVWGNISKAAADF